MVGVVGPSPAEDLFADRYEVLEELASGGSAIVYRVIDTRDGRELALKCLRSEKPDARAVRLFRDEYHTLCQLSHPRIVSVYDYGLCDSRAYYTMELLDGIDVREAAPLPVLEVCRLLRDVASALAMLHARRLLHRDVSYRNVRCTASGCAKLIDFGAMTAVGIAAEVIGTPPFIPPEALNGMALEPRADLYALGALAYWMLSARHAYPASNLQVLRQLWAAKPPAAVSLLVEGVPDELDRLVMSLLCQDPQGRPACAAEVMDRLGAIAQLTPVEDLGVAAAYLTKPALVGRERERKRIREYVKRDADAAARGPLLIEGAEGLGKTRMIEELLIEAKLAGWVTIAVSPSAVSERYAVARELLEQLVAEVPGELGAISSEDRALLACRFALFGAQPAASALSPDELRHRLQAALARCFARAGRSLRLLIAVDDFQRVDDESAALLAALAGEGACGTLGLALALRPAGLSDTPAARVVRQLGTAIRLRKLGAPELAQLIDSLFGEAPNSARVAHWMYERTRGNPLECIELAHYLVEREWVHYTEGTWMLPDALPREVPQGLEQTRQARIAALSVEQQRLAEAMAIFAYPISLELCALLSELREVEAQHALDALLQLDVLTVANGEYLFRAEALREAIVKQLSPERAQALHERAGQLLLQRQPHDLPLKVRAAHHLLRGSSRRQGADLVLAIARDPNTARDIAESFDAPLELALQIYEEQRAAPVDTIPLRIRLLNAAFLYDRSLVRYSAGLLPQLWRDAGLDLLSESERTGADSRAALTAVRERASARYELTPLAQRGLPPMEALATLSSISVLVLAAAILKWDIPLIAQIWQLVEPIARPGSTDMLAAAPQLVGIALRGLQAGESANHEERVAYLERLRDLTQYPGFPEARRLSISATQLHNIGMAISVLDAETALRQADEIDGFGLQMYQGAAMQVRLMVFMYRGELDNAQACRARIDVLALQGGAGTQFELWLAPYLADPYALWDDVLGLKQAASHLKRLAASDAGYMPMAWIAVGHHCRVRGDYPKALDAFRRARALAPRDEHASWLLGLCGQVDTMVEAGEYASALEIGQQLLGTLHYSARFNAIIQHRMARGMALAEAHLGLLEQASARCERALGAELDLGKSPLHLGRLHEAQARIALLRADSVSFARHLAKVRDYFAVTRNPVLIKRHERLAAQGRTRFVSISPHSDLYAQSAISSLAELSEPEQRARRALELILREINVDDGFLYLTRGNELELAAATTQRPPPDGLHVMLSTLMSDMTQGSDVTITLSPTPTQGIETMTLNCGQEQFIPVPLAVNIDGVHAIVGVVAIPLSGAGALGVPHRGLIDAITASLYASGDVALTHAP